MNLRKTSKKSWVMILAAVTMVSTTATKTAHAFSMERIGVGGGLMVPLDSHFISFTDNFNGFVEILGKKGFLLSDGRFHAQFQVQHFPFRTQRGSSYNQILAKIGTQLGGVNPGKGGNGLSYAPLFSLLFGGGGDFLALTGANQTYNFSAGIVVEAMPGIEFSLTDSITAAVSTPVQLMYFSETFLNWNLNLHVRMGL